jgi:K(+)-stimulated pyrophosphate-energized sodium pump
MNILIKLTCLIGLVIAPILGGHVEEGVAMLDTKTEITKEISVEINDANQATEAKGTVTSMTTDANGDVTISKEEVAGTLEEVKAKTNEVVKELESKE